MTLIIAAHYDSFDQAGAAARQLFDQGFPVADMHTFYVNPPGGQAPQPSGGDTAAEAPAGGAWLGAVLLGAAAASAAALALAPAWAVILLGAAGAYLGSLGGGTACCWRCGSIRGAKPRAAACCAPMAARIWSAPTAGGAMAAGKTSMPAPGARRVSRP